MQPAVKSSSRRAQWIFLLLLLELLFSVATAAQTDSPRLAPRTAEERNAQYEAHRRITLSAVVTDTSGAEVTGLKQTDFAVFENGTSRPIVSFAEISGSSAGQVHALLVVDGINSSTSALHKQTKEIKKFLGHANPLPVPVAIAAVSNGGVSEGSASTDTGALIRDLDTRTADLQGEDCDAALPGSDMASRMSNSLPTSAQSTSGASEADCRLGLFNASMTALHQLFAEEAKAQGRAIVIWLGPGWPIPPEPQRGQIMPSSGTGRANDMVTTLSADMLAGQIEFDAASWGGFAAPKGVRRMDASADINGASLTEQEAMLTIPALAKESGGIAYARIKSIQDVLGQLLSQGASFYKITFDPAPAIKPDDFRTVLVKVTTPGMTVRTMQSFFEQP
jgi:VWFA-related protein